MRALPRIRVDFFAADVWRYSIHPIRMLVDNSFTFGNRRGLGVLVVKQEALPVNLASEREVGIVRQSDRAFVLGTGEQVCADSLNLLTVEDDWAHRHPLRDVNHAHNNGSLTGPFVATFRRI